MSKVDRPALNESSAAVTGCIWCVATITARLQRRAPPWPTSRTASGSHEVDVDGGRVQDDRGHYGRGGRGGLRVLVRHVAAPLDECRIGEKSENIELVAIGIL